jgi:phenylacetate-CoA ligase
VSLVMSRLAVTVESVARPSRMRMYRSFMTSQYQPITIRRARQDEDLAALLAFAERDVPYYRRLFAEAGIHAGDVRGARDLSALPVLTKAMIRERPDAFQPEAGGGAPFRQGRTGGSTGEPLQYRMSNEDHDAGVALLYRGWGCGGYRPGDSMVIVAGGSLVSSTQTLSGRARDWLTNIRHLSSFGMTPERMAAYLEFISRWRPQYVRGYASSLSALASFALHRGIRLRSSPGAVFSTAESLTPSARHAIGQAFGSDVFDTYGLNDGGVSAYECDRHAGFHVDLERAVLEVVDEAGRPVVGSPGRILATSLLNRAMPFIRYDTGDIGVMSPETCSCGRTGPLLTSVLGRQTDILVINGVTISSPLGRLMADTSASWYQVVQTDASSVTFRIVNPNVGTRRHDESTVTSFMRRHAGEGAQISFEYLDLPDDVSAGDKHRVIVNRWLPPDDSATGTTTG